MVHYASALVALGPRCLVLAGHHYVKLAYSHGTRQNRTTSGSLQLFNNSCSWLRDTMTLISWALIASRFPGPKVITLELDATPLMTASVLGSRCFTRLKVDQMCGIELNLLPLFLSAHRKKKCASSPPSFLRVLSWEPQSLLKIASKVYIIAVPPFFKKVCMSTRHQTGRLIDHLPGNYYDQIDAALIAAGQSQDSNHVDNSLFFCINDNNTNGNINFVEFCANGCQDGGEGKSDFCK